MEHSTTANLPDALDGDTLVAIRQSVMGNRQPYEQIAKAMNCTPRAIYLLVDRYKIPYIQILNRRYVDVADIQKAIVRQQANSPRRSRGRPRKATA